MDLRRSRAWPATFRPDERRRWTRRWRCATNEFIASSALGVNHDYFAFAADALALRLFSMAGPNPAATVSTTRRSFCVNASWLARYRANTATTLVSASIGSARAERRVLYLVGSFRYPGSTEGLPFRIGLLFCATQPESPSPTGIFKD